MNDEEYNKNRGNDIRRDNEKEKKIELNLVNEVASIRNNDNGISLTNSYPWMNSQNGLCQ